ncbi:MAG TPA: glycine--tRNA ligase subunit beta [Methylomirabilota bacterium]|nr:glycine--tRNA ligase subunit beta [Methylomirabilota bacterium]
MKKAAKKGRDATAELLFEIGCEEIPAGMLPRAESELRALLERYLSAESLAPQVNLEVYSTPRRLVGAATGLLRTQPDSTKEILGPPRSVAYDSVGAPTRAAVSFAEKQGVALNALELAVTAKGEYLMVRQVTPGRPAPEILRQVLPRVIGDLAWPRSMTWTSCDGPRFIRPIRWILAVFDGKPLRFEFGGLTSGNLTRGHRFCGSAAIPVRGFREYESKLARNAVLLRPERRAAKISKELAAAAKRLGCTTHRDPELLAQVTYLNEFPTVITGDFDAAYLSLPAEILITVMRGHQKYFALEKKNGELAPHFLAVINLPGDPKGQVRAGHERVLRARFADARFFWQADQKCRLADYLPRLERVTYESRLGSFRDKVERVREIARRLAEQWAALGLTQAGVADADRAAELAKCDLATEMVRELPELQGVVGGLYAQAQGESNEVAGAIYDQYRPVGLDDPIPRNLTGCTLAVADKLDSVVGCFAVGIVPTGSSDPFALRRAAQGIVKILLERKLALSLSQAVATARAALAKSLPRLNLSESRDAHILEFILDRARYFFREKLGFAYDEVNAVLRAGADDLADAHRRVEALHAVRKSRNFEPLATSFKRVRKILEKAPAADKGQPIRPDGFSLEAERELFAAVRRTSAKVRDAKRAGKYSEALEVIAGLRKSVDRFFEEVMVMAEEEAARRNRLALLAELLGEFSTIADFSELGGEEARGAVV